MPETDKHCFVIGPIGDEASPERIHADWLYKGIILPVFNNKDYPDWVVDRADTIATPGMISSQIINRLHDVALVIADLSFHNANAFYEMSIRHKVGKPIIHMIRKGEKIPFDVTMPGHASRFLGLDGIEWLLIFGTALMLGAIVTLSHLFDQSVDVINSPSAKLAEFI